MMTLRGLSNPLNTKHLRLLNCSAIHFWPSDEQRHTETHREGHWHRHWMMHSKQGRAVPVMTNKTKLGFAVCSSWIVDTVSLKNLLRADQESNPARQNLPHHWAWAVPLQSTKSMLFRMSRECTYHKDATQQSQSKSSLTSQSDAKITVLDKSENHRAG